MKMPNPYDHLIGKEVRLVPVDEHAYLDTVAPLTGTYEGVQLVEGAPLHCLSRIATVVQDGKPVEMKVNAGGLNHKYLKTIEEV
jgi:hypothetical protein